MDLESVLGLKENSNYALMKTLYNRPRKLENGKRSDALLTLIYKNLNNGKLEKFEIDDPKIEGYMAKEDVRIEQPEIYIERNKLKKIEFSYANKALDLAKMLGQDAVNFYYENMKNGNYKAAQNLVYYKDFFSTDINIEDFYRIKSLEHFGLKEEVFTSLTKGYLDIETDIEKDPTFNVDDATGDAPINAVSFVSARDKMCFTLLLRDDTNPQIQELEENVEDFLQEVSDHFGKVTDANGKKLFEGIRYGLKFFDQEIDLIKELFKLIHHLKLDFIFIWNMRFDIRYIYQKIVRLGYDPREIMCDPTFKSDTCYFKLDTNKDTADKIKTRGDEFTIACYSTFRDQMIQYGEVRKAKDLPSYKLDAIGEKEINQGKVDYSEVGNIKTLAKRNYKLFVLYSIGDVLEQYGIENKVKDTEFIFQKAFEAGVRMEKASKETIYNTTLMYIYFKRQGFILGTNQNTGKAEKEEKFEGALVGNPELNEATGAKILGKKSSHYFKDVCDQDVEAEYPTVIMSCNIDPKTQIFRVIMDKSKTTKREVYDDFEKYDRGGKFLDDIQIREPILFMHRWHNLPSSADIIKGFEDFCPEESRKPIFKKRKPIFKNKRCS